jgi:hypothetical protein
MRNLLDLGMLHTSSAEGNAVKWWNSQKGFTLWQRQKMRRFAARSFSRHSQLFEFQRFM